MLLFCVGIPVLAWHRTVSVNDFLVLCQYGLLDHVPRFSVGRKTISPWVPSICFLAGNEMKRPPVLLMILLSSTRKKLSKLVEANGRIGSLVG
jgi:hypothetical protein